MSIAFLASVSGIKDTREVPVHAVYRKEHIMSEISTSPGALTAPASPSVATSKSAVISPSAATIQKIQRERKLYAAVYAVLLIGTVLTVAMYYVHFDAVWQMVAVALLIAATKAAFVVAVFMHLWHGQRDIYRIMFFTSIFVAALLGFLTYSLFSLPGSGHYLR